MAGSLDGQHVLVTGGSSGIGAACCDSFTQAGARVTNFDRNEFEGGERPGVRDVKMDFTEPGQILGAVKQLSGEVDVFLSNAGIFKPGSVGEVGEGMAEMRSVMIDGPITLLQELKEAGKLSDKFRILVMSSIMSLPPTGEEAWLAPHSARLGAYSAVKAGVDGMAISWRNADFETQTIHPGPTRTSMTGGNDPHYAENIAELGWEVWHTPGEIAQVAMRLIDEPRWTQALYHPHEKGFRYIEGESTVEQATRQISPA